MWYRRIGANGVGTVLARPVTGNWRRLASWAALGAFVVGCAAPQPGPGVSRAGSQQAGPTSLKRFIVAVAADLPTMNGRLNWPLPGTSSLDDLVTAGLAKPDPEKVLRPQLAEAVPSVENGFWRVFPDGRMETTWRLASGARWHDGRPVTTDDLRFTMVLAGDKTLAEYFDPITNRVHEWDLAR